MRAVASRFASILLVSLLVLGCRGETSGPVHEAPLAHAVLAPDARVLGEDTLSVLSSIGPDGVWIFSELTPILDALEVGDVLIAGIGPQTPYGALAKVESIAGHGAGLLVGTRQAALTEAFEELAVRVETTLDLDDPEGKLQEELGEGVSKQARPLGLSLPFHFSKESDGGKNRLDLQGSLALDPTFDLTIDLSIVEFQLKELSMEFGATEAFSADLVAKGEQAVDESATLGQISFTPIVLIIPIPVPPGAVPVVLTPRLSFVAGIQGKVEGDLSASVRQSAGFKAGIGYRDRKIQAYSESFSDFENEEPVYHGSANVKATAGPQLAVLLYGLVGPFAGVDAFVGFHASLQGPPPCAMGVIDAGLTGKIGVDFIAKYSTILFDKRFPVATFDGCTDDPDAPRPAITWARTLGRAGSAGDIAKAVIEAHDGSLLVVGDSGLFQGAKAFSAALWALRLDALGNVVWQRAYQRSSEIGLIQGAQEVPGGFLVAGSAGLMKIDSGGNLVWIRTIRGDAQMEIASISAYPDGSFLLAGTHPIKRVAWAMRLDPDGEVRWSRRYGGEALSRARVTSDGGAIFLANDGAAPTFSKVDAEGEIEWQRTLTNTFNAAGGLDEAQLVDSSEYAFDLVEKPGGGYVVAGRGYSNFPIPEPGPAGFYAPTIFELDGGGENVSATIYRAPVDGSYGAAFAVGVRPSGSMVVVGRHVGKVEDLLKREDVLILQGGTFDTLGGAGNDAVYAGILDGLGQGMPLAMTADGGAVVVATSDSFSGTEQFWVVKLNRTAGIDLPHRKPVSGNSYQNPHARTSAGGGMSSELEVKSVLVSPDLPSEVTEILVGRQTP